MQSNKKQMTMDKGKGKETELAKGWNHEREQVKPKNANGTDKASGSASKKRSKPNKVCT